MLLTKVEELTNILIDRGYTNLLKLHQHRAVFGVVGDVWAISSGNGSCISFL